jgi:putative ABC transport system ATP-binding protein
MSDDRSAMRTNGHVTMNGSEPRTEFVARAAEPTQPDQRVGDRNAGRSGRADDLHDARSGRGGADDRKGAANGQGGANDRNGTANGRGGADVRDGAAKPVIRVTNLVKDYSRGESVVHALRSISATVEPGEFVAVMGPSGSGKSTFMNLIGCLDRPSSGSYELDGVEVTHLEPTKLADLRNHKLGFIFQGFNLLPRMDALGNVMLPMVYAGVPKQIRQKRAEVALEAVGLGSRMQHRSNELSGGQQQRVAIARALVNGPSLILADEPTGNLDSRTSVEIMAILQRLNQAGATIVLVTHEPDIAAYCSRTVVFKDGVVLSDHANAHPQSAAEMLANWPAEDDSNAA